MTDLPPVEDSGPRKGKRIVTFAGTVTLYDPNADDVSRANRPIVPEAPAVGILEQAIENAVAELGYAVNAKFSNSDK